jgi:alkanesulfonate monooxygenase SsuD/methylene tetrahydromethanopterin reductase-like flavin-dependent oxidoreductase (luciferase family)
MRYALYVPSAREFADARLLADLARDAERTGWDGVFIWDELSMAAGAGPPAVADPWVALTAMAMTTVRIALGPLVTPVPRRRPAKLAREAATLDVLSGGRLVLGVGLGAPVASNFTAFGEPAAAGVRAEKLDEGLAILDGLWSGAPFDFQGRHFTVRDTAFLPRPLQRPRVPIWVGAFWPATPPAPRLARWDGLFPIARGWPDELLTPDDYRDVAAFARSVRAAGEPFDIAAAGSFDPGAVADYDRAGVTWLLEMVDSVDGARERIERGPPLERKPREAAPRAPA